MWTILFCLIGVIILRCTFVCGEWLQVTQQMVEVKNIIEKVEQISITSCQLRCKIDERCTSIGSVERNLMGEVTKCFLLGEEVYRYDGKDIGSTIQLHVVEVAVRNLHFGKAAIVTFGYKKDIDGYYYKYHNEYATWADAKALCEREVARLAVIDTDASFRALRRQIKQTDGWFWLGATDPTQTKIYKWVSSKHVMMRKGGPAYYWNGGEPNNWRGKQSDCMMTIKSRDGRFSDGVCSEKKSFLCQRR